jgi:hypothetical protein
VAILEAQPLRYPKSRERSETKVLMGEIPKRNGLPAELFAPTPLDLALQRLGKAIGKPRLG